MSTPFTDTATDRPSATRAFFGGFGSGTLNGALMMAIFSGLSFLFGVGLPALGSVLIPVLATGLFGAFMATKHAFSHSPDRTPTANQTTIAIPAPSLGASPTLTPVMAPAMDVAEPAPAKSWAADTGRTAGSESRIQEILANGAMSDKDRASAILAARETETAAGITTNRR